MMIIHTTYFNIKFYKFIDVVFFKDKIKQVLNFSTSLIIYSALRVAKNFTRLSIFAQ